MPLNKETKTLYSLLFLFKSLNQQTTTFSPQNKNRLNSLIFNTESRVTVRRPDSRASVWFSY